MRKNHVKMLSTLSMLIALEVVLSRWLSINAWNLKIGFSFVPLAIAGILYGPVGGAICGGVADIIGATLFPSGTFFFGFTFTTICIGAIYGLILQKKRTLPWVIAAVGISQLLCSLLMNTYWITILYNSSFAALLSTRIMQNLLLFPIKVATIMMILKTPNLINKKD